MLLSNWVSGQVSPTITLSSNKTVCSNTDFTFSVTDLQSSTTTYTLTFGTNTLVEVSATGQATFTITGGIVSQTLFRVFAENSAGTDSSSAPVYVPILASTGTLSTTSSLTVCYGEALDAAIYGDGNLGTASATLSGDSSSASVTYQWQYKTPGDSWQNFPANSTSSTLATSTLAAFPIFENITIRRVSYATRNGVSCSSGLLFPEISVTVSNVIDPIINLPATGIDVCTDQDYTFSTATVPGVTHYWYLGGALVQTGDSYTLTAGTVSVDTSLGLIASNGTCSSTTVSTTLEVSTLPNLTLTTGLTGDALCEGDSFSLTVQDVQSSNTTYTLSYGSGLFTEVSASGEATFTVSDIILRSGGCSDTNFNYLCSQTS
jgi:hypothetical protein